MFQEARGLAIKLAHVSSRGLDLFAAEVKVTQICKNIASDCCGTAATRIVG